MKIGASYPPHSTSFVMVIDGKDEIVDEVVVVEFEAFVEFADIS